MFFLNTNSFSTAAEGGDISDTIKNIYYTYCSVKRAEQCRGMKAKSISNLTQFT